MSPVKTIIPMLARMTRTFITRVDTSGRKRLGQAAAPASRPSGANY
jgi:hypothetical protein